eukprot:TRINITY_DN45421_c0_g1_i3.p1 TRINITY_DN45421_c0_g1~~TRINITY_DN45421_c0_g1_i3.p1  ORF type:complete len:303 (+),score=45.78 TRINITY_DN45421_c0_g1_i3:158-1066(+)
MCIRDSPNIINEADIGIDQDKFSVYNFQRHECACKIIETLLEIKLYDEQPLSYRILNLPVELSRKTPDFIFLNKTSTKLIIIDISISGNPSMTIDLKNKKYLDLTKLKYKILDENELQLEVAEEGITAEIIYFIFPMYGRQFLDSIKNLAAIHGRYIDPDFLSIIERISIVIDNEIKTNKYLMTSYSKRIEKNKNAFKTYSQFKDFIGKVKIEPFREYNKVPDNELDEYLNKEYNLYEKDITSDTLPPLTKDFPIQELNDVAKSCFNKITDLKITASLKFPIIQEFLNKNLHSELNLSLIHI